MNRICSAKKQQHSNNLINKLVDDTNKEIVLPTDISNCLNKYFCNIGENLMKKIPPSNSTNFNDYLRNPVKNSIFIEPITSTEIMNLILSLKGSKSCGADGVSPQLLKDNAFLFAEPLQYIFNLSIMNSVVPSSLKIAKVIPIFKKGDNKKPSNYRPISFLSVFNKLLEKIVYRRLYNFLIKIMYYISISLALGKIIQLR